MKACASWTFLHYTRQQSCQTELPSGAGLWACFCSYWTLAPDSSQKQWGWCLERFSTATCMLKVTNCVQTHSKQFFLGGDETRLTGKTRCKLSCTDLCAILSNFLWLYLSPITCTCTLVGIQSSHNIHIHENLTAHVCTCTSERRNLHVLRGLLS